MRSFRACRRLVALLAAVAFLCAGCAGVPDALTQPLTDARAAVRASLLSVQLMDSGRLTKAAAVTALDDMAQELSDAATAVERVPTRDDGEREERALALDAIASATLAVLDVHDEVSSTGPDHDHEQQLVDADRRVSEALAQVRPER